MPERTTTSTTTMDPMMQRSTSPRRGPALRLATPLLAALMLAGCSSFVPRPVAQPEPTPDVAPQFPVPPQFAAPAPAAAASAPVYQDHRGFMVDARLQQTVAAALAGNRDLRQAVANVERVQAAYRIQRAERLPTVGGSLQSTRTGSAGGDAPTTSSWEIAAGVTAYEIDLFGRVRALSEAALERFFATDAQRRAAEVSLVGEVANVWLSLAAQRSLLGVAEQTLDSQLRSLDLARQRHRIGVLSGLDVARAEQQVQVARNDVARYRGQIAQSRNLLALLVGQPVPEAWLPERLEAVAIGVAPLPAGLASDVLLKRPDVMAAEHSLRAAGLGIDAARKAYFPQIRLTGAIGHASGDLGDLLDPGSRFWRILPSVSLNLLDGGRRDANLDIADADRKLALAAYEKSVQTGFKEVADALALQATTAEQLAAQQELLTAAERTERLTDARFRAGQDSSLALLDAQRALYAAQQGVVGARLAELLNRVASYKALGGGVQGP